MSFRKGRGKNKMSGLPSWGARMDPRHWVKVGVRMGEAQLSPLYTSGYFRGNQRAGVGRTPGIQENRFLPPCHLEGAVGSGKSNKSYYLRVHPDDNQGPVILFPGPRSQSFSLWGGKGSLGPIQPLSGGWLPAVWSLLQLWSSLQG